MFGKRLFRFYMCSSFAVHLLHKSVLTAWLAPNGQLFLLTDRADCCSSVPLYLYYNIRSGFVKATGPELLFGPVMPYAVVSCRICSFYIKFHKTEQFKPYSVSFDVFYSNLKYSRTILTRSVKNRLSCRQAGGQPGLPAAHSQIALNSSG